MRRRVFVLAAAAATAALPAIAERRRGRDRPARVDDAAHPPRVGRAAPAAGAAQGRRSASGNAGCYPVVMQQATPVLTDYTIPLSAFSTPRWCGPDAPTVGQTLPAVERVEVTANDAPAGAVDFRIGHIDFLAEVPAAVPAEPDGRWRLAWGDDFDGAPGAPPSLARWQPDADASQDGLGHLALRPRATDRTALRATPANTLLYGRVDVRLRMPAAADGTSATVRLALQGAANDAGAIVLLEGDARGAFAAGLDAPASPARGQRLRAPRAAPLDAGFHTITCEWETDRIRWLVDGALAQERRRDDLVAAAAAAQGMPTASPAVAATAPRRRPVTTAASNSAAAPAPAKRVVCEHSARYELMLCY